MAFPCLAADSLDPMDHILSFDVTLIIPKTIWKMIYAAFYPITMYIRGSILDNRVHQDVCIVQILLEFSLTWIRLILTPGLPYALRSLGFDPSLSLVKLYKEPLGTLKAYREIESKETIVHCCRNLYLSLHPFLPLENFFVLPKLAFC